MSRNWLNPLNWWSWVSWLWAAATLELLWLLLPVILLVLALTEARRQRNQQASSIAARRVQRDAATQARGGGLTGAVRWMILGDGLTMALRWRLARAQRMIGGLAGRLAAAEISLVELAPALNEMRLSADELGPSTAVVSPEVAGRLYVGLYLGDCGVAAGILMANNAQLPLVLAAVTSLAIATCQFAVGKVLGKALTERKADPAPVAGPLVVLVLIGVSLAALLHHLSWSWAFLAVTPAVGAAALTVASHDPPRQRYYRVKSRMRAPRRRALRALRRLGRSIGRTSAAWTQAAALTTRGILAPELAEAAAADIIVVGADLTAQARGIDSMLNDLEALRLHGSFEEIVGRMHALLDQLAQVTAVHFAAYQQAPGAGAAVDTGHTSVDGAGARPTSADTDAGASALAAGSSTDTARSTEPAGHALTGGDARAFHDPARTPRPRFGPLVDTVSADEPTNGNHPNAVMQ